MAAKARRRVPYEEVAADIREQIASGKLTPGSQLGSLRALREHYRVAEGTVQSALRMLRDEGLVETFQGRGSYVLRTPAEPEPSPEYLALTAEVSRLAARVEAAEAQAGAVSELREAVAGLQAQIMNLYHSVGQPYPYEQNAATAGREAV